MLALAFLLAMLTTHVASADSVTLAWDANPEPEVVGYYVFIGTASGVYSTVVDVGSATSYTFGAAQAGTTYYLTVAAYVAGPVIGQYAPEVVATIGGGPTLSNPGNRTSPRGTALTLSLSASDPNGDAVTFGASGLPTGLSLNTATGVISGTPTTAGAFSASVTASDPSGSVASQSFVWTVSATDATAPVLAITSPTSSATYSTSSAFVTLSGTASDDVGVTSVTWANSLGGSGTAAGTTSWSVIVPLQTGSNVLTLTAKDATDKSTNAVLTVTVDTAPTVTITSPTSASAYTSSTATLSLGGTAADDVSVSRVTWTNSRGGSGTATGTTTWSAAGIALQSGTNVLTVTAQDATGHSSTDTLSVTWAPPSLQLTALTANKTAPQPSGTTITFTATASGGNAPYQYKWWLFDGSSWSIAQNWSTTSTFAWTPASANSGYKVGVWVRSADHTADSSDNNSSNSSVAFPITQGVSPLAITSMTSDKPSPQYVSTAIRFTAAASGGTAPYEFKWRVFDGSSWLVAQTWSSSATLTWTPTVANAAYQVEVWARGAGNSTDAAESANASATRAFTITAAPTARLTLTALTADKAAPQFPSTTVTFTATASGGSAPHQYKWWLFDGSSWSVAQNWSTANTFAWTPTKAGSAYRIGVWVRNAGSSTDASDNDTSNGSVAFPIANVQSLAITSVSVDRPSPQATGTTITLSAAAAGGTGPYSYKWRVFNGSSWAVLQNWSANAWVTWTPSAAGSAYQVEVWARSAGNTVDAPENAGASATRAFVINAPASGLTLTAITANKAAPQTAGTTITFTATATGGTTPYEYKWWLFDGAGWSVMQNWSASSTLAWTPKTASAGYKIGVWVRSAGSSGDTSDNANGSVQFPITSGVDPLVTTSTPASPLRLLALTPDKASPLTVGTTVTVTATATGGAPQYLYKWWLFDGQSWTMLTGWSSSASYAWTPAARGRNYRIGVWVRSSTSSSDMSDNDASNGSIQLVVQ